MCSKLNELSTKFRFEELEKQTKFNFTGTMKSREVPTFRPWFFCRNSKTTFHRNEKRNDVNETADFPENRPCPMAFTENIKKALEIKGKKHFDKSLSQNRFSRKHGEMKICSLVGKKNNEETEILDEKLVSNYDGTCLSRRFFKREEGKLLFMRNRN